MHIEVQLTARQYDLVKKGLIDLAGKYPEVEDEVDRMFEMFEGIESMLPHGGPWERHGREIRSEDDLEIKTERGIFHLATFGDDIRLIDLAIEMMEDGVPLQIVRHGVVILTMT